MHKNCNRADKRAYDIRILIHFDKDHEAIKIEKLIIFAIKFLFKRVITNVK